MKIKGAMIKMPEDKIHKFLGKKPKKIKYLRLGYKANPKKRETKTKKPKKAVKKVDDGDHECAGGSQCKSCKTNQIINTENTETGGGYCGSGTNCKGRNCRECEEMPKFLIIDYSR